MRVERHWNDSRAALLLGLAVGGAAHLLALPGNAPSIWGELAVAAGTRPPAEMFPGLWRALVTGINLALGTTLTLKAVPVLGCVALGLVAALTYLMFVAFLRGVVKIYPYHAGLMGRLIRFSSFFGAVAFATSDAVWQAGQAGSPLVLAALVVLAAYAGVGRFLQTGRPGALYPAAFLLGAFAADSPYVAVLSLGWVVVYGLAEWRINAATGAQETRLKTQLVRWKITFMYVLGALAALGGIFALFIRQGGADANGLEGGRLLLACLSQWVAQLTVSATPVGWLFLGVLVASPFAMALVMVRRATDEEQFFPYRDGLLFIVLVLIACSQLSVLHPLWIWNWTERTLVASPALRTIALMMCSAVLAMGAMVLFVYVFCRAREAQQEVAVDYENDPDGLHLEEGTRSHRSRARSRLFCTVVLLAVLIGGLVGDRAQVRLRVERGILESYLDETLAEAAGCDELFTDGRFDDALRLRTKAAGDGPNPRGLYLPQTPLNASLLTRGAGSSELVLAARQGAATYLRTLVRDFPAKVAKAGFQVGFEQWRRDLRATPPVGGLVARAAWPEGLRERGRAAAEALADRVLAYYARFGGGNGGDRDTFGYVETVQWRLARLAQVRAEQLDLAGNAAGARAETARAEALDAQNASLHRIQADMVAAERSCQRSQSPREALAAALRKADFRLAKFYAEQVLADEPTNRPANFAMGMALAEKSQYAQAADHLAKSLAPGSRDPVLYNNLAMAQLAAGQVEAARTNALKAVELAPQSAAVRDTLKRVEAAGKGGRGSSRRAKSILTRFCDD